MNATAIRNANWDEIQAELAGKREVIWQWLIDHGPATTTAISEATNIGLLTVRPRVSELVVWGYAVCVGRSGREGIYRACTISEVRATWSHFHPDVVIDQLNFKF